MNAHRWSAYSLFALSLFFRGDRDLSCRDHALGRKQTGRRFTWICRACALIAFIAASAVAQNYTMYTVAGGGLPNQVLATSVGVQYPDAVAIDAAGNIYVGTDTGIFKVDTAGILTALVDHGAYAL